MANSKGYIFMDEVVMSSHFVYLKVSKKNTCGQILNCSFEKDMWNSIYFKKYL